MDYLVYLADYSEYLTDYLVYLTDYLEYLADYLKSLDGYLKSKSHHTHVLPPRLISCNKMFQTLQVQDKKQH